jgi:ABC-2 type transport system ATP-binding protein
VATEGLTKRFGDLVAVDGIDLAVPAGAVFGFLGPNGSGKTTTIRMLLGLITPSGGRLHLVGALVEGPAFYPWLSGRDNLVRFDAAGPDGQRASRARRVADALARVGLEAAAGRKYRAYSLGMRQRLGLAAALLRPRDLLVLDEPTNGMDPQGTREIRHLIRDLASEGRTVFLSSHLLSEVEQVCTHAAVMSAGRILAQGTLAELRAAGESRLVVGVDDPARAATVLAGLGLSEVSVGAGEVSALLGGQAGPEVCCRELVLAGLGVSYLSAARPSLEDLFVSLTGEGFDVAR